MGCRLEKRNLFQWPPAVWPGSSPRSCAGHGTGPPGTKAPGQRPPRPWRAPAFPALAGQALTESRSLTGGQTRVAFPGPGRRRRRCHRCNGRGHRPCQSAAPGSGPAGGQSPRPAPDPPPAGASRPPGRALAFRGAWTCRSAGHRPARAGKRGSRLLFPPGGTKAVSTLQWQGPSPLPQRRADP